MMKLVALEARLHEGNIGIHRQELTIEKETPKLYKLKFDPIDLKTTRVFYGSQLDKSTVGIVTPNDTRPYIGYVKLAVVTTLDEEPNTLKTLIQMLKTEVQRQVDVIKLTEANIDQYEQNAYLVRKGTIKERMVK